MLSECCKNIHIITHSEAVTILNTATEQLEISNNALSPEEGALSSHITGVLSK